MQHHRAARKHWIWSETNLTNWVCVVADSYYYQAKGSLSKTRYRYRGKWQMTPPPTHTQSAVLCVVLTGSTICVSRSVWESGMAQHDVISEMCASIAIFRWKLNCKRQTWISLCLSLSSWQEQSEAWLRFKLTSLLLANICHQMAMETIAQNGWILYSPEGLLQ